MKLFTTVLIGIVNAMSYVAYNQGGFADVPATASTLSGMDATALRRIAWKSKYKEDSVRPSIFTEVKTIFKVVAGEINIIKPGILLDVSDIGKRDVGGGQSVRCALRTPLQNAPQEGTGADMLGNEDETDLYYMTFYYNEIKKAVKYNTWGYDHNDTDYLNYIEGYSSIMGNFWKELDDHRFQTTLLMGCSNELTAAPVSQTQKFNKNWAIPNLATSSYPTWDVDTITRTNGAVDSTGYYPNRYYSGAGTFVENIAAALMAGAGTGATSTALLDVDAIHEIHAYVEDEHVVEPIMMDGVPSYILKVPPKVYDWMANPNNTGSLGAYWQNVKDYITEDRMRLPGEIGRLLNSWVVVKDPRCPTLTVSGSAGSYVLTPGYIRPGNNDDRNNAAWSNTSGATNYAFDICTLMGANALGRYTKDGLVMDLIETTEYKKREGRGSYKGCGIMLPEYDKGTPTSTTQIQRGSLVIPVSRVRVGS